MDIFRSKNKSNTLEATESYLVESVIS